MRLENGVFYPIPFADLEAMMAVHGTEVAEQRI